MKIKKLGKRRSRYTFRKAGPSGRGKGRTRYHVDFATTFKFLGTIEGCPGSWTLDEGRVDEVTAYRTREEAAVALETAEKPKPQTCIHRWPGSLA